MQRGMLTEAEWRARKKHHKPTWVGAQCVYPRGIYRKLSDRSLQRKIGLTAMVISLLILSFSFSRDEIAFEDYQAEVSQEWSVRSVSAVGYQLPHNVHFEPYTLSKTKLMKGKMLFLNEAYLMPEEMLPPNTVSIAQYGKGMVPVQSLTVRSGYETIDALKEWFTQLRAKGIEGFYVSQGTMSKIQQKEALVAYCRQEMKKAYPEEAAIRAKTAVEWPGTGSLLQEYTVEIMPVNGLLLEETKQGQQLLQLCWRYGFVRESQDQPYRFRYVGKAHAAAMTYLDLDLETYLLWLQHKKVLTISSGGQYQYMIFCSQMQGNYAVFQLPENAEYEFSLDNMGYALAACTMKTP